MRYEEAIKHLSDPTVISAIFNKNTREAVRAVVRHAKEEGIDTSFNSPYKDKEPREDIRDKE